VADDLMTNVFGLTAIHPGSSTGGVLDRRKIGKPEVMCETPLCHPSSQKLLDVTYYKYMQRVQLLSNAQLQWILSISLKKAY
jgi:hypothetical protein